MSSRSLRSKAPGIAALVIATGCGRFDFDPRAGDAAVDSGDPFPDLIAWYPMDDLVGGVATDVTGHGHSGQCGSLGSCPAVTAGRIGNGFAFDGTSQLIVVPQSPVFDSGAAFTVAFWMSLQVLLQAPSFTCVVNKPIGTAAVNAWQLCVTFNNELFFGGGGLDLYSAMGLVPIGGWHHVAIRWDGGIKTVSFDGVDVAQQGATLMFDGNPITIGMDIDNGTPAAGFGGTLDDVRIYGRALSPAELQALASAP